MNYEQAAAIITGYFAQQWGNQTKVAYDDVPFSQPNNATWVRLTIQHFDGFQASTGSPLSNRFRRHGLITAQVFQPQGKGSIDARKKADLIVPIFQGKSINGIQFYDVHAREIGNDGAGFYQINVLSYFRYDTIA